MKKIFIISLIVMLLSSLSLDYFGQTVTGAVSLISSIIFTVVSGLILAYTYKD